MADQATKIEPPAMRAGRLGIERGAVSEPFCDWRGRGVPYGASEGEIAHSLAISLKRIADALEGAARSDAKPPYRVGGLHDPA